MATYKRRKYFIDKQMQTKYIALTVLLLSFYTVIFIAILLSPYAIPLSFDYPAEIQAKAARTLLTLHKSIWPALAFLIALMGFLSIYITHKIAGPVYRLRKTLEQVADGDLDVKIVLRKHDDLKPLAEDLNQVIADLRSFVATLREDQTTMTECIAELDERIRNNQISAEQGRALLERLRTSQQRSAQALEKYSD